MAQENSNSMTNSLESWMKLRDMMLESWSKTMSDVVSSDAYAQATGTMLDSYLNMSTPAQQAVERIMDPILAQMNMPSRTEIITLANRLTNVEMRLDDMDAKLDAILLALQELAQTKTAPAD